MTGMTLDELGALTLETLVRRRRDEMSIGIAQPGELESISRNLAGEAPHQGLLTRWLPVAIRVSGEYVIRLVGDLREYDGVWITSAVVRLDAESGLARTSSGSC